MKHFTGILPILLICLCAFAQPAAAQYQWSDPAPLLPEPADQSNAWLGYANDLGMVVFYERSTGPDATAIYYKKYLTNDPPVEVLSEPSVHFKNPLVWNIPQVSDTTFLLIFEKVYNGKTEIHYLKFAPDGGHSGPLPLATTGNSNADFVVSDMTFFDMIAWNSDGHLLVSIRNFNNGFSGFTAPDTVDSGEFMGMGFLWPNNLFWAKNGMDEDHILSSQIDGSYTWSQPDTLISEAQISLMKRNPGDSPLFTWSYMDEDVWNINNSGGGAAFDPLEITNNEPYDFGLFAAYYPVDEQDLYLEIYTLAYPHDTLGNREIFIYNNQEWPNHYQLSFLETESRNPNIFKGETTYYGFDGYLIWEAQVDGYWQLYYSKSPYYWGSINENKQSFGISVSPNPATDHILIRNDRNLNLQIRLFDLNGKMLLNRQENEPEISLPLPGLHSGLYLLELSHYEGVTTRKIIIE